MINTAEDVGQKVECRGWRMEEEDGGWKMEDGGRIQQTDIGQRTRNGGRYAEDGGRERRQRTENGGRGRKSDYEEWTSEGGGPRTKEDVPPSQPPHPGALDVSHPRDDSEGAVNNSCDTLRKVNIFTAVRLC